MVIVVVLLLVGGIWYYVNNSTGVQRAAIETSQTSSESNSSVNVIAPSSATISSSGGTIQLSDGSSVFIPPGFLDQSEDATLSLSDASMVLQPNQTIVGVGNALTLVFPEPLSKGFFTADAVRKPATSTELVFTINMGKNTPILLHGSAPAANITVGTSSQVLFPSGGYNSSTDQAVIYVNPAYLRIVAGVQKVVVSMANFSPSIPVMP